MTVRTEIHPGTRQHRRPLQNGKVLAALGAAAFLLQLLVWSVYAPVMALGLPTSLCVTDSAQPGLPAPADRGNHQDPCGFCLLAQGMGDAPPLPAMPGRAVDFVLISLQLPGDAAPVFGFLDTHRARGPPTKEFVATNSFV